MSKKILIYGGSSLISKELINILVKENYSFVIFCRKAEVFFNNISSLNIEKNKFDVFEADLLDLQKNFELIVSLQIYSLFEACRIYLKDGANIPHKNIKECCFCCVFA